MGTRLADDRCRSASPISTGPVAQFEPDHVDLHGVEDGEGRADLGAGQHAPGQLDRHLRLDRHLAAECRHGPPAAVDRRLDREHVELGFDEEEVHTSLEQTKGLLLVRGAEVGVGDLPERRELRPWTHGAGHPPWSLGRGELVPHGARQFGCLTVQFAGPVGQSVFSQHDRRRAERVGFDHVGAHLVERAVQLGDRVRPGLDEDLVAPLEVGTSEVVRTQAEELKVGARGAVEDDDALVQCPQVVAGGRVEAAQQFRAVQVWGGHGHPRILASRKPPLPRRLHPPECKDRGVRDDDRCR